MIAHPGFALGADFGVAYPMYVPRPAAQYLPGSVTARITNLPNHMLNDSIFHTILQQANLDRYITRCRTTPGDRFGTALITFINLESAVRCSTHFHGRQWDKNGEKVVVKIVEQSPAPSWEQPVEFVEPADMTQPCFVPLDDEALHDASPYPFSAEAPVFVPSPSLCAEMMPPPGLKVEAWGERPFALSDASTFLSDGSTEDGDVLSADEQPR